MRKSKKTVKREWQMRRNWGKKNNKDPAQSGMEEVNGEDDFVRNFVLKTRATRSRGAG